jgi:hypothetical protein
VTLGPARRALTAGAVQAAPVAGSVGRMREIGVKLAAR